MKEDQHHHSGEFILYVTDDGESRVECRLVDETIWLSLNQIAELFDRDKSVISKHLKNIFEDGELAQAATVASFATVQKEGNREVNRQIDHYNLEAILPAFSTVYNKIHLTWG